MADTVVLKPHYIHAHLLWARKYANWTIEDWKGVIWSDKCVLVLGRKSRRHFIQKRGHAFKARHCNETVKL